VDGNITRWIVSGAFLMHGLGMVGGAIMTTVAKARDDRGFGRSWLLSGLSRPIEVVLGALLWGAAGLGFLVAAAGFLGGNSYWATAAWVGAAATLVAVALWAGAVPPGTYVGAALAIAVIAALVWFV
jgi:hypothetical protein